MKLEMNIDIKNIQKDILQELYNYFYKINKDSSENKDLEILLDHLVDKKIESDDLLYVYNKNKTYIDTCMNEKIRVLDYNTLYNFSGYEYFINLYQVWVSRNKKILTYNEYYPKCTDTIIIEEDDLCVVKLDQDKIKIINTFKKSDTRYIPVN